MPWYKTFEKQTNKFDLFQKAKDGLWGLRASRAEIYAAVGIKPIGIETENSSLFEDVEEIRKDQSLSETERDALVSARLGQGQFRSALLDRWGNACAVTGCTLQQVLRASHIQPWRNSTNVERLDPANGLLLAAHLDALFDAHLISFTDCGDMLVAGEVGAANQGLLGIPRRLRKALTTDEKTFLAKHRTEGEFYKKT